MQKKNQIPIIAGVVILVLAVCVGGFIYHDRKVKQEKFNAAAEKFEQGNLAEAEKGFEEIGGFNHADDMAETCKVFMEVETGLYDEAVKTADGIPDFTLKDEELQKAVDARKAEIYATAGSEESAGNNDTAADLYKTLGDYEDSENAAAYNEALQQIKDNDLEGAVKTFEGISDFRDSSDQIAKCKDYMEAADLQAAGDDESLEKAVKLFEGIGEFKDAPARALECRSIPLFREAKEKADKKDYAGAYKILNTYPANPYPGWSDLKTTCQNHIRFKEAKKYFDDEHYYKAYSIFNSLGTFKNADKMAKKCQLGSPGNKILYHNPDYDSSAVSLTIKNSNSRNTYIKMYSASDKLAARIYIKKGDSATIQLTSGTYHINQAYGDMWYGKKDMFGDAGYYTRCKVAGSYNFTLNSGYIYTMGSGVGGDSVTNDYVGSADF